MNYVWEFCLVVVVVVVSGGGGRGEEREVEIKGSQTSNVDFI